MSVASEPFFFLVSQFELLLEQLKQCPSPAGRMRLLKRMKIVIDAVDTLISTGLNKHTPENSSSLPNGQRAA